jgi:hypothetical protein
LRVFVKPFLLLTNRILKIGVAGLLKNEALTFQSKGSVPKHHSTHFQIGKTQHKFSVCGKDINVVKSIIFGIGSIEAEIDMHIEVAIGLKLIVPHVEGGDRRMVRDLFDEDGDASNLALECFSQNWIEGFVDLRVAGENEHKSSTDKLHLLDWIYALNCLMHKFGNEPEDIHHPI